MSGKFTYQVAVLEEPIYLRVPFWQPAGERLHGLARQADTRTEVLPVSLRTF